MLLYSSSSYISREFFSDEFSFSTFFIQIKEITLYHLFEIHKLYLNIVKRRQKGISLSTRIARSYMLTGLFELDKCKAEGGSFPKRQTFKFDESSERAIHSDHDDAEEK